MPSKPSRARSRSASRTKTRTPSPKKPARKSSPARKASPSRSASKKTPTKTSPAPKVETSTRRTRSRSASRPSTPAKGRTSPTQKATPIKTPLAAARPSSPSGSARPRRAAALAARENMRGTESSRVLPTKPTTTALKSSWVPRINWPKWRMNKRRVEYHLRRNAKCYFYAIVLLILAVIAYYFQKQITVQLNSIATSLQNIYEEQRKRFQTLWDQYTTPEPPIKDVPPPQKIPPNPHEEKIPAQGI